MKTGMIDINGALFKKDVADKLTSKMGIGMAEASDKILRKNKAYIVQSCNANRFEKDAFEALCLMLGLNQDTYKPEKKEPEKKPDNPIYNEDIVVGINSLYNLLNSLLAETKSTNECLRELLRKQEAEKKMLETVNSNVSKAAEKVTAIYTDVHYNMKF